MNDPFKENEELTHKDKMFYMLAYVPFANIGLFFLDIQRTQKLQKFMNQGIILLICYIILFIVLGFIWGKLVSFLTLVYFLGSIFLGLKAYNGEYVELSYVTKLVDRFMKKK